MGIIISLGEKMDALKRILMVYGISFALGILGGFAASAHLWWVSVVVIVVALVIGLVVLGGVLTANLIVGWFVIVVRILFRIFAPYEDPTVTQGIMPFALRWAISFGVGFVIPLLF